MAYDPNGDPYVPAIKRMQLALPAVDLAKVCKAQESDHVGDGVIRVPPALARNKLKVPRCNRDRHG
jgi:hypothetical protein